MIHLNVYTLFILLFALQAGAQSSLSGATISASASHSLTIRNGTTVYPTETLTSSGNLTTSSVPTSTATADYPSLSGVSACVSNCLQLSIAQTNCSSIINVNCFCNGINSNTFENSTVFCIAANCRSELEDTESIAQKFCDLASQTLTFPIPPSTTSFTPTTSSITSSPSSPTSTTSTTSSTNAATSRYIFDASSPGMAFAAVISSTFVTFLFTFFSH